MDASAASESTIEVVMATAAKRSSSRDEKAPHVQQQLPDNSKRADASASAAAAATSMTAAMTSTRAASSTLVPFLWRRRRPAAEPVPARAGQSTRAVRQNPQEPRRRLLLWTELPPWQQHGSELILTGYREASGSVAACVRSWAYLHNESVNILSHVAGALLFAYLTAALWQDAWSWTPASSASHPAGAGNNTAADRLAAAAYLAGVAVCFALSTVFHTLLCHSAPCAARGMALDIAGVLVLMAGATVPLIHFGLACGAPGARWAFHAGTAVLGTVCAAAGRESGSVGGLLASVQGPAHGHRRAALFTGFAAVSFAGPLLWATLVLADPDWRRRVDLWPGVLGTLLFNTVGAVAYTLKFPERWWPRRFDLVGASHQIMHVAVLAAAVVYAVGVDRALAFRRGDGAVCRNGFEG